MLSYDHSFGGSKAVQICTTTGDTGYALSLFLQTYTYVSCCCPTMSVAQPYHLFTYRTLIGLVPGTIKIAMHYGSLKGTFK